MKRVLVIVMALLGGYYALEYSPPAGQRSPALEHSNAALEGAISARQTNYQVQGSGEVIRVLSDDREGSRHQRFIVRLASGRTVLVAHNIDLAPRVSGLEPGQTVSFFGEYEWNERGGVIHWTHHDPQGRHVAGWLEYDGIRYQ